MLTKSLLLLLASTGLIEARSTHEFRHLHNLLRKRQNGDSLELAADALQIGSTQDGTQAIGANVANQAPSLTSENNFINVCSGKTLTNGFQNTDGSCNGIPMGDIPAKTKMVSSIITFPVHGSADIQSDVTFNITVQVSNLVAGFFTNAAATYYSAPQQLQDGQIVGHTHVTVQDMGDSLNPQTPLDPTKFAFFKGINDPGNGQGGLQAVVTGGLPKGNYRVCTMTSAANHQPVLMPVAQRGTPDDCTKFTVVGDGTVKNDAANDGVKGLAAAALAQSALDAGPGFISVKSTATGAVSATLVDDGSGVVSTSAASSIETSAPSSVDASSSAAVTDDASSSAAASASSAPFSNSTTTSRRGGNGGGRPGRPTKIRNGGGVGGGKGQSTAAQSTSAAAATSQAEEATTEVASSSAAAITTQAEEATTEVASSSAAAVTTSVDEVSSVASTTKAGNGGGKGGNGGVTKVQTAKSGKPTGKRIITIIETFFVFKKFRGGACPSVGKNGNRFNVLDELFDDLAEAAAAACGHQYTTCISFSGPGFSIEECASQKDACASVASTQSATASTPATLTASVTIPITATATVPGSVIATETISATSVASSAAGGDKAVATETQAAAAATSTASEEDEAACSIVTGTVTVDVPAASSSLCSIATGTVTVDVPIASATSSIPTAIESNAPFSNGTATSSAV